jgi:ubiquitin carboxyl-terminal hydrolase 3
MWTVQSVAISPDSFLNTIWKIVPMVCFVIVAPSLMAHPILQFRGYQQQDAQEFIRYLLDRINSELMVRRRMKKTIIFSIFQGILLNQVHCQGCEQTFVKRDAFLDLSLSIPERFVNQRNKVLQSQNPCTLEDCLESFIETEALDEADMYDCSKCRGKRRATKKLTVDRLPPVCIFLKYLIITNEVLTSCDRRSFVSI